MGVDALFDAPDGDDDGLAAVTATAFTLARSTVINVTSGFSTPLIATAIAASMQITRASSANARAPPTLFRQWPDWSSARAELKWTWMVHTYGFACVFFMLAFYAFFSVLNLRAQLSTRPYMSSINVFLCVLGSSRAICFLVDPYHSKGIMPTTFGSILWDVAFPSLISAFGLIQLAFLQLTRLRLGPAKLRSKTCMSLVITSHFMATIAINIVCTYRTDFKVFRVVCQTAFLVWGGFLCVAFLHGGFHTMQLLKHAPNSMFQRSDSSGFENKVMALGMLANCPNLATMTAAAAAAVPSFLAAAPKIRITDENEQTYSYVSVNDNSMQVGNRNSPDAPTPKSCERRRPSTPMPKPATEGKNCVYTVGDCVPTAIGSSSNVKERQRTILKKQVDEPRANNEGVTLSRKSRSHLHQDDTKSMASNGRMKLNSNNGTNHIRASRSSAPGLLGGMIGDVSVYGGGGLHRSSNGISLCSSRDVETNLEMSLLPSSIDSSTAADSPLYGVDFKQDVSLMSILNHIAYVNRAADDYSFDAHKLRPKSRKSQIEKVLQGTYASAILGFLLCALEAYRIYGPYGLLAPAPAQVSTTSSFKATASSWRSNGPAPWPWFIFQTVCRFVELSMGCFMANITKQPVNRHHYPYSYHMKHRGGGLYF